MQTHAAALLLLFSSSPTSTPPNLPHLLNLLPMAAPKASSTTPATSKADASNSKSSLLAPREFKRRLSKKGKDAQPNGTQQDATSNTAAPGGSATSSVVSSEAAAAESSAGNGSAREKSVSAGAWQDPSQAPTAQGDASTAGHTNSGDRDTMREKASLSTAATGTATGSRHRKDKSEAHSGTVVEKPTSVKDRSRRKKKSFWAKFTSALFKCTWSQDNTHPIDVDEGPSGVSDPSRYDSDHKDTVMTEREKEGPIIKEHVEASSSGQVPKEEQASSSQTEESPLTPAPDLSLPESNDPSVVVPPPATTQVPPEDATGGVTSGSVVPPGATGHEHGDESEESSFGEEEDDQKLEDDEEERLIMNGGAGIPIGPDGVPRPLLPPIAPSHLGRKCLVLDLDETLVHSSFKVSASYIYPISYYTHMIHFTSQSHMQTTSYL